MDAAFGALNLDRQRAITAALLTITVKHTGRTGRVFDRNKAIADAVRTGESS